MIKSENKDIKEYLIKKYKRNIPEPATVLSMEIFSAGPYSN